MMFTPQGGGRGRGNVPYRGRGRGGGRGQRLHQHQTDSVTPIRQNLNQAGPRPQQRLAFSQGHVVTPGGQVQPQQSMSQPGRGQYFGGRGGRGRGIRGGPDLSQPPPGDRQSQSRWDQPPPPGFIITGEEAEGPRFNLNFQVPPPPPPLTLEDIFLGSNPPPPPPPPLTPTPAPARYKCSYPNCRRTFSEKGLRGNHMRSIHWLYRECRICKEQGRGLGDYRLDTQKDVELHFKEFHHGIDKEDWKRHIISCFGKDILRTITDATVLQQQLNVQVQANSALQRENEEVKRTLEETTQRLERELREEKDRVRRRDGEIRWLKEKNQNLNQQRHYQNQNQRYRKSFNGNSGNYFHQRKNYNRSRSNSNSQSRESGVGSD